MAGAEVGGEFTRRPERKRKDEATACFGGSPLSGMQIKKKEY